VLDLLIRPGDCDDPVVRSRPGVLNADRTAGLVADSADALASLADDCAGCVLRDGHLGGGGEVVAVGSHEALLVGSVHEVLVVFIIVVVIVVPGRGEGGRGTTVAAPIVVEVSSTGTANGDHVGAPDWGRGSAHGRPSHGATCPGILGGPSHGGAAGGHEAASLGGVAPAAVLVGEHLLAVEGVVVVLGALNGAFLEGINDGGEGEEDPVQVAGHLNDAVGRLGTRVAEDLDDAAA